jgi:transmembrane sensor
MTKSQPTGTGEGAAEDQAMAWVTRLASGTATTEDAEALRRWRSESPAHQQAFAEAKLLWETLGPAAETVRRRAGPVDIRSPRVIARRALIGGALAASAAGLAYVGSQPPLRLWPTVEELRADYRTAKGEQRRVALSDDVSLILNTQTSIGILSASSGSRGIELIEGEAAITADIRDPAPVDIIAADGRATASVARFDMRREGASVSVTCFAGLVRVERRDDIATVSPGQKVVYDANGLHDASTIDPAVAAAWQNGQLIFRHQPLRQVVEEINRYRPGRIILMDGRLGQRDVVATFRLDRIDEVVEHLAQAFDARARLLPGGVVLLG